MPQYMLVLGGVSQAMNSTAADYEQVMEKYVAWTTKLRAHGLYVDTHKLKDGVGRRLTYAGGKVVDGPFAESKETIGGYYIIEAKNLEEAVAIAKECPTVAVQKGFCEVREVEI